MLLRTLIVALALSSPLAHAHSCPDGQALGSDGEHCCFYGQDWNAARGRCAGTPACPAGYEARPDLGLAETCVLAAPLKLVCNSEHDAACDQGYCKEHFDLNNVYAPTLLQGTPVVLGESYVELGSGRWQVPGAGNRSFDLKGLSQKQAREHGCLYSDRGGTGVRWCCAHF